MLFFFITSFTSNFLFSFGTPPWQTFHREAYSFSLLILFFLLSFKKNIQVIIKINSITKIFFLLIVITSIQMLFGIYDKNGTAVLFILYLIYCILLLSIPGNIITAKDCALFLSCSILAIAITTSLICLIQALDILNQNGFIVRYNYFRRPGGQIGQANHAATIILMGVASLLYIGKIFHLNKFLALILAAILMIGASSTESRTCLLSTLSIVSISFLENKQNKKDIIKIIILVFSLIFIIMPFWPSIIGIYHDPLKTPTNLLINKTSSMRLEMWTQLWQAILIKPWLGWGVLGVSEALNSVQDKFENTLPFTYSHNIIIDLAIAYGLPICIGISLFTINYFRKKINKNLDNEKSYSLLIIMIFAIHSMLEYPFAYSYMLVAPMLSIGIISDESKKNITIKKNQTIFYFSLSLMILLIIINDYIDAEQEYQKIRFENLGFQLSATEQKNIGNKKIILNQLDPLIFSSREYNKYLSNTQSSQNYKFAALNYPRYITQYNYTISLIQENKKNEACRQFLILTKMHKKNIKELNIEFFMNYCNLF